MYSPIVRCYGSPRGCSARFRRNVVCVSWADAADAEVRLEVVVARSMRKAGRRVRMVAALMGPNGVTLRPGESKGSVCPIVEGLAGGDECGSLRIGELYS